MLKNAKRRLLPICSLTLFASVGFVGCSSQMDAGRHNAGVDTITGNYKDRPYVDRVYIAIEHTDVPYEGDNIADDERVGNDLMHIIGCRKEPKDPLTEVSIELPLPPASAEEREDPLHSRYSQEEMTRLYKSRGIEIVTEGGKRTVSLPLEKRLYRHEFRNGRYLGEGNGEVECENLMGNVNPFETEKFVVSPLPQNSAKSNKKFAKSLKLGFGESVAGQLVSWTLLGNAFAQTMILFHGDIGQAVPAFLSTMTNLQFMLGNTLGLIGMWGAYGRMDAIGGQSKAQDSSAETYQVLGKTVLATDEAIKQDKNLSDRFGRCKPEKNSGLCSAIYMRKYASMFNENNVGSYDLKDTNDRSYLDGVKNFLKQSASRSFVKPVTLEASESN